MITLGDMFVKIRADATELNQAIDASEKRFTAATANFQKLGSNLTKFVTLPILAIGAASVKAAGDMEMMEAEFTTMLGSATKAKGLLGDLTALAAKTPFQLTDLAQGTKTMLAFGIAQENVLPNLRMLGDIAGGNSDKLKSLTLAFSQITATGRLMGQDLLQLINAGFNPLQNISAKTGETMAELKKRMEAGAISAEEVTGAFKDATSAGGLFFGGMERASKTFNGQVSTLKDDIAALGRGFGEMLLPAMKNIVATLSKFTKELNAMTPAQKESIINIAKFAAVMGPAILVTLKMVEAGGKLNDIFKNMATGTASPIGLAIVGIAALAVATLTFANNVKKGQEEFAKLKLVIEGGTTGKLSDDIASVNRELIHQKDLLSSSTGLWPEQDKAIQGQIDKLTVLRDKLVAQYRAQGQTAQGAKAIADAAALEIEVEKQLAEALDVTTASLENQADTAKAIAQEQYARDLEAYNFHLELLDRREARQRTHEEKLVADAKAAAEETAKAWGDAYTQMMSVSKAVFAEMGASLVEGTFQWKNLGTAAINSIGAIVSAMGDQLAAKAAATLIEAVAASLNPLTLFAAPGLYASAATLSAGAAAAWASGAALSAIKLAEGGLASSPTLAMVGDNRNYDEIVAPLSPDVFSMFADGLLNALSSRARPAGVTESSVGAARGSSATGSAVSINVGTLVADPAGLRNLERTLRKFGLQEDLRVGA